MARRGNGRQRDHLVHPLQLARLARAVAGLGGLRRGDHLGHSERGQRHRRPRWSRRRRRAAGLPGLHDHRLLGVPQPGDLRGRRRRCRQPARPRGARRGVRRSVRRVPVVQRRAGAHLHGRRRRAGHRHRAGPAGAHHRHPDPAHPDLRHQRDRGRVGRRADGRVQGLRAQAAAVPHVADPPPLRADRLAGDHGHHPLLVDLRHLRGDARWRSSSATSPGWSCTSDLDRARLRHGDQRRGRRSGARRPWRTGARRRRRAHRRQGGSGGGGRRRAGRPPRRRHARQVGGDERHRLPGAGRPRDASRRRRRRASRHADPHRDRPRLRVGAAARRRTTTDARGHRHRRQDHDDDAGRGDVAMRRIEGCRRRQHRGAVDRRARHRRRRVRRRVQQLPAELDRPLSQRGLGVAEPRPGPSELARVDGGLRTGQGADVEPQPTQRCRHRLRDAIRS